MNIIKFDTNIDVIALKNEWEKVKINAKSYDDVRGKRNDWKIVRHEFDYSKKLCNFFNVNGRPRFYILDPYAILPQHTDLETKCSLNFIINDNYAPVMFGKKEYNYKYALLNVSEEHGVINNDKERLLFKISIFDEKFDQVKIKLMNNKKIKIIN